MPILSTVAVTPPPASHPSTAGDHEPVLVTTSTVESSFEIKSTPSTELNVENNQDSLEATEQSILIYIVPIALLVLLVMLVIFFVMHHKRKKSKQGKFVFLCSERIFLGCAQHEQNVIWRPGIPHLECTSLVEVACLMDGERDLPLAGSIWAHTLPRAESSFVSCHLLLVLHTHRNCASEFQLPIMPESVYRCNCMPATVCLQR